MEEKKIETRVCIECNKEYPLSQFRKYKAGYYGHTCVNCTAKKKQVSSANKKFIDMSKFPDEVLFGELKKRGFTGSLDYHKTIAV